MLKIEKLTNMFLDMYKREIEGKELKCFTFGTDNHVRKFIYDRLNLHGRNGYKFHASMYYKKYELDIKNNESAIVEYIVDRNTFRTF